ncbi:alpha/beta-hydrolase [Fragilariopsis cylindrus CCMP1102]|uniref:Carboxypeptidase n=1 Tax=Fragilariopsis cylindrus CCMP1102 TaxID=635003 RepID=A0A1E7EYB5_9STRA|nr:alpha/beta-hydrolase [Fragilariopsis cylindrus CCMP1102]|eukprot:OEU10961.1 alpha/beta-hydrolase [Fragilariopsis cylindrus CCMP1102]
MGVNKYSWTKSTTMLYPEQPIGTGFSFGKYPENEEDVAADLWQFMQSFYGVFDHLKDYKLFIMGESYAGMYLPSVGRYFHLQNEKIRNGELLMGLPMTTDVFTIPIGGVGIGNGWMNGMIQGPAVIDYSWWHGLIDEPTRDALHNVFKACVDQWNGNDSIELPDPFHSFNVQDDCGLMWGVLQAAGNPNAYDVTTWDPNVDQVTFTSEAFYNREDIRKALHAPMNITWHGCAGGNSRRRRRRGRRSLQGGIGDDLFHRRLYLDNDRPIDVVPYVADLLDADIPVLVYNGDRDMTTGGTGSEMLLNGMNWKGKNEWLDATRGVWMAEEKKAGEGGWAKEHLGLTFVVVYNSGHMVPYNQPVAAMDLLNRFLKNETFLDLPSPTIRFGDRKIERAEVAANPTYSGGFILVRSTKEKTEGRDLLRIGCQEQAWK